MEFLTPEFWYSLAIIVGIDLFLAGDNAIVIAMAARRLPDRQRSRAILYGTAGAVVLRALCTLIVVYLLMIPGLHFVGGLLLIWIAYRLLRPESDKGKKKKVKAETSIWAAVRTIIVADALMGLDNVLAVAGAAQSDPLLVIFGLLISVPLLMGGSAIILALINRFQWLVFLGAAILALTAGRMLFAEPVFINLLGSLEAWVKWPVIIVIIAAVLYSGWRSQKKKAQVERRNRAV
ncbi:MULTISPECIES: TerC family protein [unclassified Sporolactobacillus]|uniref:TerC family protein n=1 Tax=unclassified Sporolactobacillus TaxID=2628533 RepID=UPI002368B686|nr:TerC family protein [Sporolactobacillus sp. CQH2019]MDD9149442.1 TerC family protein [Sporolactobacillus sp. CQH2019]